ncbi:MAG: hypothetical protein K8L97_21515 [Anaerolineae bacterium]|nr:hypothetical protein [Anaerolineae bacterium]
MGYYMRYIATDTTTISLEVLEAALKLIDAAYAIKPDSQIDNLGDLFYGDMRMAQLEINVPDDDIFEDDINEFRDLVGTADEPGARQVLDVLEAATCMIAVEAFWEGENSEGTLAKLDPLWDWLFANRKGMSQADSEGFYDANGLILERRFML